MEKTVTLEEALKRIEELEKENAELREELEYYRNRKLSGRQKNDNDPRFFFPKSPRQINAAEVSHINIQNRNIVLRKVFDCTGSIKQVKPHLRSSFCAMLLKQL